MYNEKLKLEFLQTQETQNMYNYIFKKSEIHEEIMSKDIYEMNFEELKSILKSFRCRSEGTINVIKSCLVQYIDWCLEKHLISTGINFLRILKSEDLKDFIDNHLKYITKDELIEMENRLQNAQDVIILDLLFHGVKGESNAEIINLKISDVDFDNNILNLTDKDNSKRQLKVSEHKIQCINDAINEDRYDKNNGLETTAKVSYFNIIPTEYVVRTAGKSSAKMQSLNVVQRLSRIKKFFGNRYLTVTNVWYSGMIEYGKQLMQEMNIEHIYSPQEREFYTKIKERFGYKNIWNQLKYKFHKYFV